MTSKALLPQDGKQADRRAGRMRARGVTSSVGRQISGAWALGPREFRVHRGCGCLSEAVPAGLGDCDWPAPAPSHPPQRTVLCEGRLPSWSISFGSLDKQPTLVRQILGDLFSVDLHPVLQAQNARFLQLLLISLGCRLHDDG